MITHLLLTLEPGIGALAQHPIVDKSRAPKGLSKDHFLLSGRVEPESIGTLDIHSHTLHDSCEKSNLRPLSLPAMNGGVSRGF